MISKYTENFYLKPTPGEVGGYLDIYWGEDLYVSSIWAEEACFIVKALQYYIENEYGVIRNKTKEG